MPLPDGVVDRHRFDPSMVYDPSRRPVRDEIRTSDGSTIHWLIEDPAVVALNRRIAAISQSRYESGEAGFAPLLAATVSAYPGFRESAENRA